MTGNTDGSGTGFVDDCLGRMMVMLPGGGLVFLRPIAVLFLSVAALIKHLRSPA